MRWNGLVIVVLQAALLAGCGGKEAFTGLEGLESPEVRLSRARELTAQAEAAYRKNDLEQARTLYEQAVVEEPVIGYAWNNLGVIRQQLGDKAGAIRAYQRAADLWPADPRPQTNIGQLWYKNGNAKPAIEAFELALQREPTHQPALRGLVRAYEMLNAADEETLEVIERAYLHETAPAWLKYLEGQRRRVRGILVSNGELLE